MLSKSCFFFIKTIKINSISSHKAAFVQRILHENWAEIERREWWYSCWGALIYSLQELQKPGGLRWRQLKSEMMHRRRKIKTFYISVCDSTSLSVFKGFLTAGRVHRRAQMLVITRARCSGVLENSSLYPHKEHEGTESHLSCRQTVSRAADFHTKENFWAHLFISAGVPLLLNPLCALEVRAPGGCPLLQDPSRLPGAGCGSVNGAPDGSGSSGSAGRREWLERRFWASPEPLINHLQGRGGGGCCLHALLDKKN